MVNTLDRCPRKDDCIRLIGMLSDGIQQTPSLIVPINLPSWTTGKCITWKSFIASLANNGIVRLKRRNGKG